MLRSPDHCWHGVTVRPIRSFAAGFTGQYKRQLQLFCLSSVLMLRAAAPLRDLYRHSEGAIVHRYTVLIERACNDGREMS
jgi:hypothetical protein